MNERSERDRLQEKGTLLSQYLAFVRETPMPDRPAEREMWEDLSPEEEIYFGRQAIQRGESLLINGFVNVMLENFLQLIRQPEEAIAIGEKGVALLHSFLEGYIDLSERESELCK